MHDIHKLTQQARHGTQSQSLNDPMQMDEKSLQLHENDGSRKLDLIPQQQQQCATSVA